MGSGIALNKLVVYIIGYVLLAVLVVSAAILVPLQFTGYFSYKTISATAEAPKYQADASITIMSANIRRQEKFFSTDSMDTGKHRWWKRAKYYLANISAVKPDILGCQEVHPRQYDFLCKHLVNYGSVVEYRDGRGKRTESCPIFTIKTVLRFWRAARSGFPKRPKR